MTKTLSSFLLITLYLPLHARPGCLDNSYHLAKRGDPKTYHELKDIYQCDCECEKKYVMMADGTCTKCMHRHDSMYLQDFFERTKAQKAVINIRELKKFKPQK